MTYELSDVGVVVVTFNSERTIAEALRALPTGLHGIVVIDNGSADDTVEVAARTRSDAAVIVSPQNDGFGAGCNRGASEVASARLLLFLNPDASVTPDAIRALCAYLDANATCALVAPRLFGSGHPLRSASGPITWVSELRWILPAHLARLVADRRLPPDYASSGPVAAVEGACMLVDAAAFRMVGGFDPAYFLFYEEHDLAQRLKGIGRTVDLCAAASALHGIGGSRDSTPHGSRPAFMTSAYRYLRRWHGPAAAGLFRQAALISWGLRARTGRLDPDLFAALRRGLHS